MTFRERFARWMHALACRVAPGVSWVYESSVGCAPSDGKRHGTWMQTWTGRKFYPLDPRPDEIDILDVAHGLAMTCRYGGHTQRFYSVAEHCVFVSHHVDPAVAREALLHDTAEAYIGDMVRPLKIQPEMESFRRAEAAIEDAVAVRFELRTDPVTRREVKRVDDRILRDEMLAFMRFPDMYLERARNGLNSDPLGADVRGLEPADAEALFLARFAELFPEHTGTA